MEPPPSPTLARVGTLVVAVEPTNSNALSFRTALAVRNLLFPEPFMTSGVTSYPI